ALYRVWVAEIMLQQTRVDTVIDYYQRWMCAFPSWHALASASQDELLKCWEGLGYYSRARNLHAAAQQVVSQYGDEAPTLDATALREFPGVGSYTAAAIASLAFNEDAAVVDGNVIRVLCRLFAYTGDTKSASGKKIMQNWADELLVHGRAGEFNEAMMELGALVCLPKNPACDICPMRTVCSALKQGEPTAFPVKKKKEKVPHLVVGAAVTVNSKGEILIAKRLDKGMLAGLWEFPGGKLEPDETIEECIARELHEELGVRLTVGDRLMTVKHAYSHFTMTMHVHFAKIRSGRPKPLHCADFAWVKPVDFGQFAWSKADLQVVEKLQGLPRSENFGKKVEADG
ncbi:MAG: A/G-specific adenine glycosylase, partial [Kiritimatiellaceae bacterium]|nr:A/G-specific adenine glycosylase [Kiritimatiellaceae bacterium]